VIRKEERYVGKMVQQLHMGKKEERKANKKVRGLSKARHGRCN